MINTSLSIIIPTKNRYRTLIPVVESILNFIHGDEYEIIVQDNSDDNMPWIKWSNNKNISNLKYFYTDSSLSIQENTELGISRSTGQFLIFIGDDDLISPYILEVVKYMKLNRIDALIYQPGYYWWNSVEFVEESNFHKKNAFWIPKLTNINLKELDPKKELMKVINDGGVSYYDLPRLYHGVISRSTIESVKLKVNKYVIGSCPDISLAASIALVIDKYYKIDFPVSIFGASKGSGGGLSASNQHYGKIDEMKFLPRNILSRWDKSIPLIWSAHTYYANSLIEVLSAFNISSNLNFNALYGSMLAYEPHLKRYVFEKIYMNNKPKEVSIIKVFKVYIKKRIGIIYRKIKFKNSKVNYFLYNANDTSECMNILTEIRFN